MKRIRGLVWAVGLTLVACGGSSSGDGIGGDVDAGSSPGDSSAPIDSGVTPKDSGAPPADGGKDSGSTSTDTGSPPGDTAASDTAASDTASDDTATGADTPPPTEGGPVNDGITCGAATCFSPQICCIGFAGAASYDCTAPEACTGLKAKAFCDGPEDCPSGNVCCASFPSGDACKTACASGDSQLCHSDGDCSAGQTCKACASPGGGPTVSVCVTGGTCPF